MSIVRLDKIQASANGNIESVKYADGILYNGNVINLNGLVSGETELMVAATPVTATLATEEVLLIASPEVVYESGKGLKDFSIAAGTAARALHLTAGDIFTLTTDVVTGESATIADDVGKYLIPANGVATLAVGTDISGVRFAAKIIEATTLGYDSAKAFAVQVVKA